MIISSRTPEGSPHRCPVCGAMSAVETSSPLGDSCCPSCGQLLVWFQDRLEGREGEMVTLASSFGGDVLLDSLDLVELIMELEEEFDITIPDEDAERIRTVADAIRFIQERRDRSDDAP